MAVVSFSVPKYRHHRGTGQSFVQVRGKRHYLGRYGAPESKERYARFVAELSSSPTAIPLPPKTAATGLTIAELPDA